MEKIDQGHGSHPFQHNLGYLYCHTVQTIDTKQNVIAYLQLPVMQVVVNLFSA